MGGGRQKYMSEFEMQYIIKTAMLYSEFESGGDLYLI